MPATEYFGIAYPTDKITSSEESIVYVTESRKEALEICKKVKGSRFKTFLSREEAVRFSEHGQEVVDGGNIAGPLPSEKPSGFSGPSSQEIVKLRKAAEAGNVQYFHSTVWNNPRFLISSGDTPVTSGGQKYNLLHFICKANQAEVGKELLKTITDKEFFRKYYPDDSESHLTEKCERYLDYFLNTPDKTSQETPLHVASKFGCLECVELLCSYVATDTKKLNKDGKTALDLVCDRADKPLDVREKLQKLLSDRYYIPVILCDDFTDQRVIGDLWSPDVTIDEADFQAPPPRNMDPPSTPPRVRPGTTPIKQSVTPSRLAGMNVTPFRLPPESGSPFSVNLGQRVVAYVGPTDRETAASIHKQWKTPPRITPGRSNRLDVVATPPRRNSSAESKSIREDKFLLQSPTFHDEVRHFNTPLPTDSALRRPRAFSCALGDDEPDSGNAARYRALSEARMMDPERGLHNFGMELCLERGVPFKEFWPFLNEYVNIRSDDGLEKLDKYLKARSGEVSRQKLDMNKLADELEKIVICRKDIETGSSPKLRKNVASNASVSLSNISKLSDESESVTKPSESVTKPVNGTPKLGERIIPRGPLKCSENVTKLVIAKPKLNLDENDNAAKTPVSDLCAKLQKMSLVTPKLSETILAFETPSDSGDLDRSSWSEPKSESALGDIDKRKTLGVSGQSEIEEMLDGVSKPMQEGDIKPSGAEQDNGTPERNQGLCGLLRYHIANGNVPEKAVRRLFAPENSDEDSDDDVFETPESSPDYAVTPEEEAGVFIEGTEPSKIDRDVMRALNGVQIDPRRFPYVFVWQHCANQAVGKHHGFSSPFLNFPLRTSCPTSPLSEPISSLRFGAKKLPFSPLVFNGIAPLKDK